MLYDHKKEEATMAYLLNDADNLERIYAAQHLKTGYLHRPELKEIMRVITQFVLEGRTIGRDNVEDHMLLSYHGPDRTQVIMTVENLTRGPKVDLFETIPYLKTLFQRRILDRQLADEVKLMIETGKTIEQIRTHVHQTMLTLEGDKVQLTHQEKLDTYVEQVYQLQAQEESPIIATGLEELDAKFPMRPGRYRVLGALPKVGKTTLAKSLVMKAMTKNPEGVAGKFFSQELRWLRLYNEIIAEQTGIVGKRLEGEGIALSDEELARVTAAAARIKSYQLDVVDTIITMEEMYIECVRFSIQHPGKKLIGVLDHSKKLVFNRPTMRDQVIAVSNTVSRICHDLNFHFMLLHQLNTKKLLSDDYADSLHRPDTSFLSEASAIEEDADEVALLWRPSLYRRGEEIPDFDDMYVLCEKQRGDQTNFDFLLGFTGKYSQIHNHPQSKNRG